ncbi:MAG: N-acetylmuramoyl-L-alanine amidase [Spirulinaceae cyanobacterium]
MNKILCRTALGGVIAGSVWLELATMSPAESTLFLSYPPDNHQTTASQIFLIGSGNLDVDVSINGEVIERSSQGYFAPSFPLEMGENLFTIRQGNQEVKLKIIRTSEQATVPQGVTFAENSLTPQVDLARLPGELICFSAIAPTNATISVQIGTEDIPLFPQDASIYLPPNSAALTAENTSAATTITNQYQGCTSFANPASLGQPLYQMSLNGETVSQESPGQIEILTPQQLQTVEVTATAGVSRTGPSTNYSRLTPLPQGTRAAVTGKEGEWLRLDYGAWLKKEETRPLPGITPPQSLIRSITSRQVSGATEIVFPLQIPVPISIEQGERTFTLNLYNLTAQTDIIRLDDDPLIKRLDWQQVTPSQVRYTFNLKSEQQWGYDLRYEGNNLILSLRHPPSISRNSLEGISILIDPGHGGEELGARGPNGLPEKEVNLIVSKLLQQELVARGATVYLTRETDIDVSLGDRVEAINKLQPTLALSVHYNALPDSGDALNTAGIGMFWYHPQAHDLAVHLHNYLVDKLSRPSYGVFWDNLALTRPHNAPSLLMELGFMINPEEFEWVTNPQQQEKLAQVIAEGISVWLQEQR